MFLYETLESKPFIFKRVLSMLFALELGTSFSCLPSRAYDKMKSKGGEIIACTWERRWYLSLRCCSLRKECQE